MARASSSSAGTTPEKRTRTKVGSTSTRVVAKPGVKREKGYSYFVQPEKDGKISVVRMVQFQKGAKKETVGCFDAPTKREVGSGWGPMYLDKDGNVSQAKRGGAKKA